MMVLFCFVLWKQIFFSFFCNLHCFGVHDLGAVGEMGVLGHIWQERRFCSVEGYLFIFLT